jgi:hypothetical protein
MKTFKMWAREMWYQHQDELESWGQKLPYEARGYFAKYKYWLKREYRYRKQQGTL